MPPIQLYLPLRIQLEWSLGLRTTSPRFPRSSEDVSTARIRIPALVVSKKKPIREKIGWTTTEELRALQDEVELAPADPTNSRTQMSYPVLFVNFSTITQLAK